MLDVDIETFALQEYKHMSHRIIMHFWKIKVIEEPTFKNVKKSRLTALKYPVPKLIESFLHDEGWQIHCKAVHLNDNNLKT